MKSLLFRLPPTPLPSSPFPNPHHYQSPNLKASPIPKPNPFRCFSLSQDLQQPPVVVVGSANADIYVEISRLPAPGETIAATSGQTLAGGKGANQACCAAKLSLANPAFFVGQIGDDAHGKLIENSLSDKCGVHLDCLSRLDGIPTGHAVVMLQEGGQNSIVIVGGANMGGWPEEGVRERDLEVVRRAGVVLLQREIPDRVNVVVAKAAHDAGVPVILDVGGVEAPIPEELMKCVDILSPNETELARLTGMQCESLEELGQAVRKCHKMGVRQVLVKLGAKGSAFFVDGEEPVIQPIIPAAKVVDTTGAGDTFTAAFAVALLEGKSKRECLQFAAAAASLCIQVKGAIPSMPDRNAVDKLLQSH